MIKTTRLGSISGIDDNQIQTFLGVRYGEPPINERRFKASVASGGWSNTLDATSFPNRAMQDKKLDADGRKIPGKVSEDCLFLNIYQPKNAKKLVRKTLKYEKLTYEKHVRKTCIRKTFRGTYTKN